MAIACNFCGRKQLLGIEYTEQSAIQFRFFYPQKGPGYGIKTKQVDGNNLLEVYHAIAEASKSMKKKNEPFLIECMTFRMRGHEEASGTKYYPEGLQDKWAKKDPVTNYEKFLLKEKVLTKELKKEIREPKSKKAIDEGY